MENRILKTMLFDTILIIGLVGAMTFITNYHIDSRFEKLEKIISEN